MGVFGWSYPPGCSGTPFDEPFAIDLKAGFLPPNALAFWVDGEMIEVQDNSVGEYGQILLRVPYDVWDDDLSEPENSLKAVAFLKEKWDEKVR